MQTVFNNQKNLNIYQWGNGQVKCGIFIQRDAIKKSKKIFKGQWYTLLCKWVLILIFFLFFWPHAACRIFASSLGNEPMLPAEEAWCLNHWTVREVSNFKLSISIH